MSVQQWTVLVILSTSLAFAIAIRKDFPISEVCEGLQRYYNLLQPFFYGFILKFKKYDKNLQGVVKIIPSPNIVINDCKALLSPNGSLVILSSIIKDELITVVSTERPWVEICDPVVNIQMKSEKFQGYRIVTVYSVEVDFSKALVNKTSLSQIETKSVKNTLSVALTEYALAKPFKVRDEFRVTKRLGLEALKEMLQYYLYRLSN